MKSIIGKQTDHVHTFRRDSRDFRLKKMKVIVKEKKLLLNKPCWKSCFTSHRKKCYHLGRYVSYEKTGATSYIVTHVSTALLNERANKNRTIHLQAD